MTDILEILRGFGEIEWCGIPNITDRTFHPEMQKFPPVIVVRYVVRTDELANKIRQAVDSFDGKVKWSFDSSRRNWVISPSEVKDRNDVTRLSISNPEYGTSAFLDLPKLAEHLKNTISLT